MKKLTWTFALATLLAGVSSAALCQGQQPVAPRAAVQTETVPDSIASSPEYWLYLNEQRRYDDPRQAVRRNAEAVASQRRARIAAMKWFGYSNSRPQANPVPFMATYSPGWSSNGWDNYRWEGTSGGPSTVIINPGYPYRR